MSPELQSWTDTPTRRAIVEFVERVTAEAGADYVPPPERIAVFDNDGTLWCEKPMPIELGFILMRLSEMAEADQALRGKQPWKVAREKDYTWLGNAITKHYQGDDAEVRVLMGGILQAFAGMSVDDYSTAADAFLRGGKHPTSGARSTRAATSRWSSSCATSRRTGSRTTSPRAATETSCGP